MVSKFLNSGPKTAKQKNPKNSKLKWIQVVSFLLSVACVDLLEIRAKLGCLDAFEGDSF